MLTKPVWFIVQFSVYTKKVKNFTLILPSFLKGKSVVIPLYSIIRTKINEFKNIKKGIDNYTFLLLFQYAYALFTNDA